MKIDRTAKPSSYNTLIDIVDIAKDDELTRNSDKS
jgi:hypothetical protein